jgi:transcription elongation factor GreA
MNEGKKLAEAATDFLASLPANERDECRQELNKFVRWCGSDRLLNELAAPEVANYAESIDGTSVNTTQRIAPVKAFLTYAKKKSFTQSNLSVHLRVKKVTPRKGPQHHRPRPATLNMSEEGYRKLADELSSLKDERPKIADSIRKAAADKDFRENAPLDAAKEHQGMVEARIRELEHALKSSAIKTEKTDSTKVSIGSTVVLRDVCNNEEVRYKLVNPREANPLKGKLSVESPTGKALLSRTQGEVIEVVAPAGTLRYRVQKIE